VPVEGVSGIIKKGPQGQLIAPKKRDPNDKTHMMITKKSPAAGGPAEAKPEKEKKDKSK